MSQSQDFPVLFTVGTTNRHDIILINAQTTPEEIIEKVESLVASSPNCAEPLAKYSKQKGAYKVNEIKVRWSGEPIEARLWPKATVLTKENSEALLALVSLHAGRDVLEIHMNQAPNPKGEEEEGKGEAEGEGESKE